MIRVVRVRDAVGLKLAHDYTCVEPWFKGAVKKRGEVVSESDVELLEKCGHYYVYVYDEEPHRPGYVHEVEAVKRLGEAISGSGLRVKEAEEGKAYVVAEESGLLVVDSEGLKKINSTGVFVVVTRRTGSFLRKGDLAGVVDLVPLEVPETYLEQLIEELKPRLPLLRLYKSKHPRVGVIATGTEIVEGLKKDLATPIVAKKIQEYECIMGRTLYARDDLGEISEKILELLEDHDAVVLVGGMSVDPTDLTPQAIRQVADEVVAYGIPIKPNTMSMIAYKGDKAVIGVPASIIYYSEENALDLLLPWVSAGVKITRDYLVGLGEGGMMSSFLSKLKKS